MEYWVKEKDFSYDEARAKSLKKTYKEITAFVKENLKDDWEVHLEFFGKKLRVIGKNSSRKGKSNFYYFNEINEDVLNILLERIKVDLSVVPV